VPTLLAFIPHPDDESYSFGGLIALAANAGWDCFVQCASYGEKGKRHDGGRTTPNDVAEAREAELVASCAVLGANEPVFWGLPDGELRLHRGEHARIAGLVRTLRPDVMVTLGADGAYGHPDHTSLHRWVMDAWSAMDQPPPLLFPVFLKGLFLPQWQKCRHMLGEPPQPAAENVGSDEWHYEVPIAAVREQKLAGIAAHRSQLPGGEPEALFAPGIVANLLDVERFEDARGSRDAETARLLSSLVEATRAREQST
jgi:LmbE family N-acetylglucosaminyl deacetylase